MTELDRTLTVIRRIPGRESRLRALAVYIDVAEERLRVARAIRAEDVAALRAQEPQVTWQRIERLTGVSEAYLRRIARGRPRR